MPEEKRSIRDFIYWLEKNNDKTLDEKIYTEGQIAQIIGKTMVSFFEESDTPYWDMEEKISEKMKEFLQPTGCEHGDEWVLICNTCFGNFCDNCFGRNDCFDCEESNTLD